MSKRSIIITGCLGFIGSHFTKRCLDSNWDVTGIDKITYAANLECLDEFSANGSFHFIQEDIRDLKELPSGDLLVNFAAETHVDNSINDSRNFILTNINGVENLLELIRKNRTGKKVLVQISTDEVYGSALGSNAFDESSPLNPGNPYASSKAAADLMVKAWHRTHGNDYQIIRLSNVYGTRQSAEKLIPKSIQCLSAGSKVPLYGDGKFYRHWLHVEDAVEGINVVIDKGESNCVYNLQGDHELSNIALVKKIINAFFDGREDDDWQKYIEFDHQRPGHDERYDMCDKRARSLGWYPLINIDEELKSIISHYKNKT